MVKPGCWASLDDNLKFQFIDYGPGNLRQADSHLSSDFRGWNNRSAPGDLAVRYRRMGFFRQCQSDCGNREGIRGKVSNGGTPDIAKRARFRGSYSREAAEPWLTRDSIFWQHSLNSGCRTTDFRGVAASAFLPVTEGLQVLLPFDCPGPSDRRRCVFLHRQVFLVHPTSKEFLSGNLGLSLHSAKHKLRGDYLRRFFCVDGLVSSDHSSSDGPANLQYRSAQHRVGHRGHLCPGHLSPKQC